MINLRGMNRICASNEDFLHIADNSSLGVILIHRGVLQYFNERFGKIFGYSMEEVSKWKKREFYKIVHPDDLANLTQKLRIDENQVITLRFRGVRKEGSIIPIENYVCVVRVNKKKTMLSSYTILNKPLERNTIDSKNKETFFIELSMNKETLQELIRFCKNLKIDIKEIIKILN